MWAIHLKSDGASCNEWVVNPEVSVHLTLPLLREGWSFMVTSTKGSPCRAEACLLTWETCGGVAARKALTLGQRHRRLGPSEGIDEEDEEISEDDVKGLRKVWAGPCWEGRWPFRDPWDAVGTRMTASRWNLPGQYGPSMSTSSS